MWASHGTVRKAFDSPVKPVTGNDTTSKAGCGFGLLSRSVQRLALPTLPAGRGKQLAGAWRLYGSRLAVVTWRAPHGLAPASSLPNIARGIGADSGYGMTEGGSGIGCGRSCYHDVLDLVELGLLVGQSCRSGGRLNQLAMRRYAAADLEQAIRSEQAGQSVICVFPRNASPKRSYLYPKMQ